jgi:hypothetical protein
MRFWTSIVGYNPRDHSLSQSIYLIYVTIFFILWGFAVLALLANLGAGVLSLVEGSSPSMTATMIVSVVLLIDALMRGYSSGKRSPFIFSDADAELLCQTPVDRRQVALAWCLGDGISGGLAFVALAVVLRFASLQLVEQGGILWAHIPHYWLAGLKIASIILPLHIAFMAIDYALGALRLQRDKDNPWLRWVPIGVAVVLIALAFFTRTGIQIILWPMLFPLEGGFGEVNWLIGFVLAVILATGGLLVLYWGSPWLNLSRAAQESRFRWAVQQISWLGDSRLVQQMKARQRLGAGHYANRIPGRVGYSALIWKDWVVSLRTLNFGYVMGWIGVFGVCLGMAIAPDWGTRIWAFIFWCLLIGQRCTERLRGDPEVWAVTRQLPFSGRETLVAEIATPVLGATLLSWLAIGVSSWLGFSPSLSLIFLVPVAIMCIVMAAVFDILRHCRSSELLSGQVAELGAGGLILGIILAGIPLIIVSWLASQFTAPGLIWLAALLGLALSLVIIYLLLKLTAAMFNDIK